MTRTKSAGHDGINAENERVKRRYFSFLIDANQRSKPAVDAIAKALNRFEAYTRFKSFRTFRPEQAIGFKNHLERQVSVRTKEPLSKVTAYSTLAALKAFLQWLSREPGFKKRLNYTDADYFSLSLKDTAIAKAGNAERVPTLDQIRHVIGAMPAETDIEKRDRALVAFVLLTGARDNAVASVRLKHVDLAEGKILQDASRSGPNSPSLSSGRRRNSRHLRRVGDTLAKRKALGFGRPALSGDAHRRWRERSF